MRLPGSDAIAMALQVPIRNPGRSALTTLGLAIGVASFIAMVSFGRGARSSVVTQFETLGSNLLRLKANYSVSSRDPRPLTEADLRALRRETTALAYVAPFAVTNADVTAHGRHFRTNVRGTTPEFTKTREYVLASGGVFDAIDVSQRNKVCVIGATVASQLFADADPLGEVMMIDNRLPCRVIGVVAKRGSGVSGGDMDDLLIMPLSAYEAYFGLPNGYWQIEIRPQSRVLLPAARAEVFQVMRRSHHIEPGQEDDFSVISPDEVTQVADQIGGILTGLLAGIAAVSLLVGGIGIMNIQLVSVAERTHEIGIRAAIGAAPGQIMGQFIAEAVVLASLGSAAGVALGIGVAVLAAYLMHWPVATSADVVLGSALFGVLVGTLFGYIPAKRAASLDPIEALRRE